MGVAGTTVGVLVAVAVGVAGTTVGVLVAVAVAVAVWVGMAVAVSVAVAVAEGFAVGVSVAVSVGIAVGVMHGSTICAATRPLSAPAASKLMATISETTKASMGIFCFIFAPLIVTVGGRQRRSFDQNPIGGKHNAFRETAVQDVSSGGVSRDGRRGRSGTLWSGYRT